MREGLASFDYVIEKEHLSFSRCFFYSNSHDYSPFNFPIPMAEAVGCYSS